MSRPESGAGTNFVVFCGTIVAYADVWMEAMANEFDGLVVAGTFVGVSETPGGCNIVGAKWLYRWKDDSHDMV